MQREVRQTVAASGVRALLAGVSTTLGDWTVATRRIGLIFERHRHQYILVPASTAAPATSPNEGSQVEMSHP